MTKLSLTEDGIPGFLILTATAGGQEVARLYLTADMFDADMSVREHPVLVTAVRIAADLKSPAAGNWQAAAQFLDGIEDAAAFAAGLGYQLADWL